jgi:malate dehydrogenase (oxaloacetate-decarboxylating)
MTDECVFFCFLLHYLMASIYDERALELHAQYRGKLAVQSKVSLATKDDLSVYYTPWVAAPCLAIAADPSLAYTYTWKSNAVAVISDGSAVLGLGNIWWIAGLPVMEGKAILMKAFADLDAIPLVLSTQDPDAIIATVKAVAPTFGAINLEDIAAPACFYIEEQLNAQLDIPVFHDDQHGTAIVVLAALINACTIKQATLADLRIVIAGAGAAGIAIAKLLVHAGAQHIILTDSQGIIWPHRTDLNQYKTWLVPYNTRCHEGDLCDALVDADVVIGVSKPNIITPAMIQSMRADSIIFALSNPNPEITRDDAIAAGAFIYASWRSDVPNQINNILAFPGILRGAIDARVRTITMDHKYHAAHVLAKYVQVPTRDQLLPDPLDKAVPWVVAGVFRME